MIKNGEQGPKNTRNMSKMAKRAQDLSPEQRIEDEKFMRRCLQLASHGHAGARPNPMVGAVVVCDGRILGEGYHICQGGPHAEVNAIAAVKETGLLPLCTIYVSLEPCAHYGKTPPCADLIVSRGIRRCVIGCKDPFAKVDGLGIKKLLDAGVDVTVGVLEQECMALNRTFVTYHTLNRPYITLKWAQSQDGMLNNPDLARPVRFSTSLTMTLMHRHRALSDAILVGGRTVLTDNPSLTVRSWVPRGETGNLPLSLKEKYGEVAGHPLRILIDTKGDIPHSCRIFSEDSETLVWENWKMEELMQVLYERNIQTLLVEGGAETHRRFLEAGLWDEIRVETAPLVLGKGVKAPSLEGLQAAEQYVVDGNVIALYYHD